MFLNIHEYWKFGFNHRKNSTNNYMESSNTSPLSVNVIVIQINFEAKDFNKSSNEFIFLICFYSSQTESSGKK